MLCIFLPLCVLLLRGVSGADTDRESVTVTVNEGDPVTLNTGVKVNHRDRIKWFFNNARIAQIIGNISNCIDIQCKDGDERFKDRLKLDHQTGSLTITNIRNTDSGLYELQIFSSSPDSLKIFNVTVSGVSAVEREEVKKLSVKKGESVTLDLGVRKNTNDEIRWNFTDILIAEITGDRSKICTDVQCEERFRGRLEANHTGSLTIMNTRTTDDGVYKLEITSRSSSFSIRRFKSFSVSVTDSGLSSGAVVGIVVLLVAAAVTAAGVIYYCKRQKPQSSRGLEIPKQENGVRFSHVSQNEDLPKGTSHDLTETANETSQ